MVKQQLDAVSKMYSKNIEESGPVSRSVGWNTEDCQNLRFEKLCSVIDDSGDNFSVNDYGCGYGAHLQYLEQHFSRRPVQYFGYDISPEMLDSASRQLAQANTSCEFFSSTELTTDADYSFVSGTFNVKFDASKDAWKNHIIKVLQQLHTHSRKGFAFNLLTSYVDYEEEHLFYGDPLFWFDYCKTHFSKKVNLLHDYDLWEWTIAVKK